MIDYDLMSWIWQILCSGKLWFLRDSCRQQAAALSCELAWSQISVWCWPKSLAPPLLTKTYTTLYPSLENTPFLRILDEKKTPFFQPKSLILRSNKTTLFIAKGDFIFIIQDKVPIFVTARSVVWSIFNYSVHRIFHYQSSTKPNLVAKILVTKFGSFLWYI